MISLALAATVTIGCTLAGCGCGAPETRGGQPSAPAAGERFEAWGATFALPAGFSGGENDSGGIELTDGELALMIGRHARSEGESFEAFAETRKQSLLEAGGVGAVETADRRVAGKAARAYAGKGAESLDVRLLVIEHGASTALTFLLAGEARHSARIDAAWAKLLASLELPPAR